MTAPANLPELLDVLGPPAHLEALIERQELLRFAESRVTYQHSEERVLVRARITRQGRSAWGTTSSLDPGALGRLRERLEATVSALPTNGDVHLAQPGPTGSAMTFYQSTASATAHDRTALFKQAVAACPTGGTLGGSIAHSLIEHSVANTNGVARTEQRTRAAVQFIGSIGDCSSFGRAVHRDAMALPTQSVVNSTIEGLRPLPKRDLDPGVYRALLGPQATITLLAIYAQIALGGRHFLDGLSPVSGQMDEQVVSPLVTVTDDGCDAAGLPTTFDSEGLSKQRVTLIDHGRLAGVVHDAETARRAGVRPTGHSAPPGWRFGADPIPSHLLMTAGSASDSDLLAAVGSGLSIQRVDYVRVVNARQALVTGTTRDATEWIDHGRVVARVPQFRFTLRLNDLLNCIEAVGTRRERGDTVFTESVVTPAIVLTGMPVQVVVRSAT
jgi:predicted Zn-dependent protease